MVKLLKALAILLAGLLFGLLLPTVTILVNVVVNQWDDAPGGGFIAVGVLLIGIGAGLLSGIGCALSSRTMTDGLMTAFLFVLMVALVLGGMLSAWIHPLHAGRGYVLACVFWFLAASVPWLWKRLNKFTAHPDR